MQAMSCFEGAPVKKDKLWPLQQQNTETSVQVNKKISKNKLCTIIKKTEKGVPSTPRQRYDRLPESPRPAIHSFLLKAHGLAMKTTSDRSKRTQKLLSTKQQRPCKLITIWECTCLSLLVELMNSDFVQLVHLLGYVNRKRACQIRERHITLSHAGKRKWQT